MSEKNIQRENWKLSKPTVADNGYGGVYHVLGDVPVDDPVLVIEIKQIESWVDNERVKRKTRTGYLEGSLEDMLCIRWEPKEITGGKIKVIEQIEPPVEEEPEMFLAYKNGRLRTYCGKPVYRLEVYVFKANTPDIILPDDK